MRYTELRSDAMDRLSRGISRSEVREMVTDVADANGSIGKVGVKQLKRLKAEFKEDFTAPGKSEIDKAIATKRIELRPRSFVSSYG